MLCCVLTGVRVYAVLCADGCESALTAAPGSHTHAWRVRRSWVRDAWDTPDTQTHQLGDTVTSAMLSRSFAASETR
eukprot:1087239-Prymnesium_polylepis.1